MDRRKKRTSLNQYLMYINMLEEDEIFRTGNIPRDVDINYISNKWKELAITLNTCCNGPSLTAEEWKKRLNDWKNSTRCKYRRSTSGEKDIALTALETRALNLFGKAPAIVKTPTATVQLKHGSEPETEPFLYDDEKVQVVKLIEDVDDDENENQYEEDVLLETQENTAQIEESLQKTQKEVQQNVKRNKSEQSVYPESITIANGATTCTTMNSAPKRLRLEDCTATTTIDGTHHFSIPLDPLLNGSEVQTIASQLKRLADAKEEKLKFEIAKFKFKNPGFDYNYSPQL